MKRPATIGAICLFLAGVVSAQTLSVEYLEGYARVSKGASWVELAIGEIVPPSASVRLGKDSCLELRSTSSRIILCRMGTYSVRDLVSANLALNSRGVTRAVSAFFGYLFTGPTGNATGVSGARGAEKNNNWDSEWVRSSAEVFLEAGEIFISSAQYEKAIEQFVRALEVASPMEIAEVKVDLAYAYLLIGNTREALNQADGVEMKGNEHWVPGFVLLKARLLMDTNAFAQEIDWLTQQGNDLS